jgi:hypothetical protein
VTPRPPPRTLLLLGVIGAAASVATRLLGFLPLGPETQWLSYLLGTAADLGLGLGLIGVFRATRRSLALVAAVLLLAVVPITLISVALHQAARTSLSLSSLGGLLDLFFYTSWAVVLASSLLLGLVALRLPVAGWKRVPTAVLFLVGLLPSAIIFGLLVLCLRLRVLSPALYEAVVPAASNVGGVILLVKMAGLALCFLELRRPVEGR